MDQNNQADKNSAEIKLDSNGEPISPRSEKKINKKIFLLIIIILVIVSIGAMYFLFLNKEDNSKLPIKNEEVAEVKIDKKLDTDQDGLPDYIEKILGTDENNPDTDGDIYNDLEEIKNGYDPLSGRKYTEEEWEAVKEKVKNEDEKMYVEMFRNFEEIIQKAVSVCQKIEEAEKKELCLAAIGENPLECDNLSSIYKESCYLESSRTVLRFII